MGERGGLTTVFVDRDGVVNRKLPEARWVTRWSEFSYLPGALDGLALLKAHGLRVIIVTNQRGIGLGLMSEDDLAVIHERMRADVAAAGGRLDAIYHCPHVDGACDCRKPAPGMLLAAARDVRGVELARSAMIGDRAHDMAAGAAVGALLVLIRGTDDPVPGVAHVAPGLLEAARWLTAGMPPASVGATAGEDRAQGLREDLQIEPQ